MRRLEGTLTPKKQEGYRDGNRGSLHISSILAGAADLFCTGNRDELQVWTEQLLRSLREFNYRQQQREASDRARLAIARKEVFSVR